MKELHKTSFRESLAIQKRVIGALLMREIITRYGRNNIGFLWLFVEPLLFTLVIVLMWKFFRASNVSALNIIAFVITGYPMMMMWRNASGRAIGSISANASLLYHRNVRVLDTILARMFLEIAGATIARRYFLHAAGLAANVRICHRLGLGHLLGCVSLRAVQQSVEQSQLCDDADFGRILFCT